MQKWEACWTCLSKMCVSEYRVKPCNPVSPSHVRPLNSHRHHSPPSQVLYSSSVTLYLCCHHQPVARFSYYSNLELPHGYVVVIISKCRIWCQQPLPTAGKKLCWNPLTLPEVTSTRIHMTLLDHCTQIYLEHNHHYMMRFSGVAGGGLPRWRQLNGNWYFPFQPSNPLAFHAKDNVVLLYL